MTKIYPMVSFRCDNQFRRELEREARRRDISVGELIRQAITNHIHTSRTSKKRIRGSSSRAEHPTFLSEDGGATPTLPLQHT